MKRTKQPLTSRLLVLPSVKLQEAVRYGGHFLFDERLVQEFNTAQCFILALYYSLLTRDLHLCRILLQLEPKIQLGLQELMNASNLVSWLRDDFQFLDKDVFAVISFAARLMEYKQLELPEYVLKIFTSLSTKYNILDQCKLQQDRLTIRLLNSMKVNGNDNQPTESDKKTLAETGDINETPILIKLMEVLKTCREETDATIASSQVIPERIPMIMFHKDLVARTIK